MVKYICLLLLIMLIGCAQTPYMKGRLASDQGEYDEAVRLLYDELKIHPESHDAWRELGITFYRKGNLIQAEEALKNANNIKPEALTNFYLGMTFEQKLKYDEAVDAYMNAINLRGDGRTKEMIRARLDALMNRKIIHEASLAINNENEIDTDTIPDNSIAVVNFDGSRLPRELEPLALGLAEFTAIDLAKIEKLRVVERIKISAILDELKVAQSHYADTNIAPRVGRLMGSRRLILGTILNPGEKDFRIDGAVVNTVDSSITRTEAFEGKLNKFFKVQKQFVFNILDTLGIEISREERDAIEEVPTESFLAFMAYSQGLFYQRQGMYDASLKSFRNAAQHDPDFQPATNMATSMAQTVAYGVGTEEGGEAATDEFEKEVLQQMNVEAQEVGLDHIQAVNIMNTGFILDPNTYFRFGSPLIPPPGGGPIQIGTAVITIEGNLDAQ